MSKKESASVVEKSSPSQENNINIIIDEPTVVRKLEARHIQMIAIGGTIGTGLFLNSANIIRDTGAIGALVSYIIAGIAVFFVVSSLGEMATLIPVSGSFATFASRFVDPALGFSVGWNYCLMWCTNLPLELLSCATFLQYWVDVDQYVLMLTILIALVIVNLFAVKGFGEIEYWLALMKICAIIFFILVGIFVLFREMPGLSKYDEAGGGFLGVSVWDGLVNTISGIIGACFSFGGTELVGITAGEAKNPRKSVPRAVNGTFFRIMLFYILSILLIGLLLPANSDRFNTGDKLTRSPFVIALQEAGIQGVNHFMNAVCFIAVLSAANSAVYASSRSLMALAENGRAPKILAKKSKNGVPYFAVGAVVCFASIAFLGKFVGDGVVFRWLVKLVGLCVIVIWVLINITHLRFRKAYIRQGYKLSDLPYRAYLFPYGCWFGIFICVSILVLGPIFSWQQAKPEDRVEDLISNIITVPFFVILYLFWKVTKRTKLVPLDEVDLVTGNSNYFEKEFDDNNINGKKKKKNAFARFLELVA